MARYYDAGDGRFITRDTFHGIQNETASLNLYAYCANNPVMYADPSGHYYKRLYLGFNGFISINVTLSSASTQLNITPGMLINIGIGVAIGGYAGTVVAKFLSSWLLPKLTILVGIYLAKKVTSNLTGRAAKYGFGFIASGNAWLNRSLWSAYYKLW